MEQFFLTSIPVKDLLKQIGEIIESKISKSNSPIVQNKQANYISRKEVCKLLHVSFPTLADYTKCGWLKSYRIGRRVLYKQDEIETSLDNINSLKYKKGGVYGK